MLYKPRLLQQKHHALIQQFHFAGIPSLRDQAYLSLYPEFRISPHISDSVFLVLTRLAFPEPSTLRLLQQRSWPASPAAQEAAEYTP